MDLERIAHGRFARFRLVFPCWCCVAVIGVVCFFSGESGVTGRLRCHGPDSQGFPHWLPHFARSSRPHPILQSAAIQTPGKTSCLARFSQRDFLNSGSLLFVEAQVRRKRAQCPRPKLQFREFFFGTFSPQNYLVKWACKCACGSICGGLFWQLEARFERAARGEKRPRICPT